MPRLDGLLKERLRLSIPRTGLPLQIIISSGASDALGLSREGGYRIQSGSDCLSLFFSLSLAIVLGKCSTIRTTTIQ